MKIRKTVFYPTVIIILMFLACYMVSPQRVNEVLDAVNRFFQQGFGWFYLAVSLFLVVVSGIVLFSGFGKTRIGGEEAKPMLSTGSWFTVVLCTTIAAGVIFWGSSEPVYHLMEPPGFLGIEAGSYEASVFSMTTMFMHWTITPYAIYSVPALMFAVAVYNQKKAFSFSSCVSGVLPRADRPLSSAVIDSMCVFATVMGMIASLGQGILSIAGGLSEISGKESSRMAWVLIGVFIAIIFTISACSGVLKGIKWISNINTVFLICLMMLVFAAGPTMYIVQLAMESFGIYLDNFFTRSLMIGAGSGSDWSYFWTIATFANWMAWAPITGMFLGKVSYGHSVRKFIVINLGAGALSSGLWISIFGGTSIYQQLHGTDLHGKMALQGMESAVYGMLKALPAGRWLIPVLAVTVVLSVVTAADSTTNVLGDLCFLGDEKDRGMKIVKVIWGALIGGMAILLICSQGVAGIKMMSVIGGLPAAALLLLSGISLLKTARQKGSLGKEGKREQQQ